MTENKFVETDHTDGDNLAQACPSPSQRMDQERISYDQSAILNIAAALRKTTTLEEMIAEILDQLLALLNAKGACLALRNHFDGSTDVVLGNGGWACASGMQLPHGKGILGYAIEHGQTYLKNDIRGDPFYTAANIPDESRSVACVPLVVSTSEVIGALMIGNDVSVMPEQVSLLDAISDMAANAIQRVRLHEQTERKTKELQELYELTLDLAGLVDLDTLLKTVVARATTLLDASGGFIYLNKPDEEVFEIVAAKNFPAPTGTEVRWGVGMVGQVAETRRSMIVDHYHEWDGRIDIFEHSPITSVVEAPMLYRGNLIGVLGVHQIDGNNRLFHDSDAELLFLFAGHAASAIKNTSLLDEVNRQVNHLQALRKIDQAIIANLDPKTTLETVLNQVTSHLNIDAGTVLLLDLEGKNLNCVAGIGFNLISPAKLSVNVKSSPVQEAATSQKTVTLAPLFRVEDHNLFSTMVVEGFEFYCISPIFSKGKLRGAVELFHHLPLAPNKEWLKTLDSFVVQIAIAIENIVLVEDLHEMNTALERAYNATLEGWSKALELRDYETEGHSQRVTYLTDCLAQLLRVEEGERAHIRRGALLHDIGKMGISDAILFKPSALDEDEWEVMRRHPKYAYNLLSPISYLEPALDIPYCHHEKWDGSGYPSGLSGTDIPLAARIFAVADVWDALTSDRPYRQAWSKKDALEYIRSQSGRHFDPTVVSAFNQLVVEDGKSIKVNGLPHFRQLARCAGVSTQSTTENLGGGYH